VVLLHTALAEDGEMTVENQIEARKRSTVGK
jgi:hypothetical protein